MSSSVREQVAALIKPLITGNRWSIQPHTVKQLGTSLTRTTVFIEHTGIDPQPIAPVGMVDNTCIVTILSALADWQKAEDALDAKVMDLIAALDASTILTWSNARKVEVAETYLGWAITLTVITQKEG